MSGKILVKFSEFKEYVKFEDALFEGALWVLPICVGVESFRWNIERPDT